MVMAMSLILEIYSGTRVVSLDQSKKIVMCSLTKLQFRDFSQQQRTSYALASSYSWDARWIDEVSVCWLVLLLQAIGGAVASSAASESTVSAVLKRSVMLLLPRYERNWASISCWQASCQVASLFLFAICCTEFALRACAFSPYARASPYLQHWKHKST
jgi:hypothetical protein